MVQVSEELMLKFINNTCSDEELQVINAWLSESEDNINQLFELERIAMLSHSLNNDSDSKKQLLDRIHNKIELYESEKRRKQRILVIKRVSGIAALITLLLTIGLVLFRQPTVKMIHISVTSDIQKVVLPDSTVVFLNKDSEFTYPEKFIADNRVVELTGEGYFNVTKDATHPFIINGEYLSVTVLGTQFNFISSKTNNSVSLLNGSVKVFTQKQNEGVVLIPGQRANYDVNTGALTVSQTNAELDIVWHNKTIPFRNANINEIIDILNYLYDMDIIIDADVNLDNTYSGVTVCYPEIDSTLTQLANVLPIRFVNRNGTIHIYTKQ